MFNFWLLIDVSYPLIPYRLIIQCCAFLQCLPQSLDAMDSAFCASFSFPLLPLHNDVFGKSTCDSKKISLKSTCDSKKNSFTWVTISNVSWTKQPCSREMRVLVKRKEGKIGRNTGFLLSFVCAQGLMGGIVACG